ncbi:MAG TPA: tetratricopeptide repeat protein, partial [Myxococcota bacterium]
SASEEGLADRPIESALLEKLGQSERVLQLHLPHLPERDHRALVEELLGLEPGFASAVAARTAGNPLFAVQLVGDFVTRGVLELTPDGFALKKGERAALPDDLHGVWSERVARVLSRAPAPAREALELGAVLGSNGDDGEWQALCDEAKVELPAALIDELLVARLVVPDEAGLRFGHAMLRESVLRAAAEGGRLEQHHQTAARMLLKRYGERRRGVAERIGRHLVAAGRFAEALPHLLHAAEEAARTQGYAQAHALLAERDAATDAADIGEDDPRRAEGWAHKASLLVDEGRIDEARMWAGLVLRFRGYPQHARVMPSAMRARAQCALQQAKWEEAERFFDEAKRASEEVNDKEQVAQCLVGLSDAAHSRGLLDQAGALLTQALAICSEMNDEEAMALCLWNAAYVAIGRGDTEQARQLLLRQQKLARRTGYRSMIANGKNALGDLERFSGRYSDAAARYEDALRLFEAIGSDKRHTVRLNMAMNALGHADIAGAKKLADALLAELHRADPRSPMCHGILTAVAARERDWKAYDLHMRAFMALKHEQGNVETDMPLAFEMIGDHARAQGDDARAAEAYENALDLWEHLGRADRKASVQKALGRIGTVPHLLRRREER